MNVVMYGFVLFWSVPAWGLQIKGVREGQVVTVGDEIVFEVESEPGEAFENVFVAVGRSSDGFREVVKSLPYRGRYTIPKDADGRLAINAFIGVAKEGNRVNRPAKVTLTVVLPPTTTVQSIRAKFSGDNETFPDIARKPSGELVALGAFSERQLSVGATYSDGVNRRIVGHPDMTYESLNEKVAKVFAPGQWEKTEDERRVPYALVQATGPGKTEIIVRYKGYESRVTVHVKECPYIEGKTEKEGCPF